MKTILILTCVSLIFLTGCSTINTVEPAESKARLQMVNDKRITTDSAVADYAYVASVNQQIVGGLLKIQLKVVNKTVAYRTVNYKFVWVDKDGMQIQSPTSTWQTLALEGGEVKYISAVAPSPNASDFTVKFLADVREY